MLMSFGANSLRLHRFATFSFFLFQFSSLSINAFNSLLKMMIESAFPIQFVTSLSLTVQCWFNNKLPILSIQRLSLKFDERQGPPFITIISDELTSCVHSSQIKPI